MHKIEIFNHIVGKAYAKKIQEIAGAPKDIASAPAESCRCITLRRGSE